MFPQQRKLTTGALLFVMLLLSFMNDEVMPFSTPVNKPNLYMKDTRVTTLKATKQSPNSMIPQSPDNSTGKASNSIEEQNLKLQQLAFQKKNGATSPVVVQKGIEADPGDKKEDPLPKTKSVPFFATFKEDNQQHHHDEKPQPETTTTTTTTVKQVDKNFEPEIAAAAEVEEPVVIESHVVEVSADAVATPKPLIDINAGKHQQQGRNLPETNYADVSMETIRPEQQMAVTTPITTSNSPPAPSGTSPSPVAEESEAAAEAVGGESHQPKPETAAKKKPIKIVPLKSNEQRRGLKF